MKSIKPKQREARGGLRLACREHQRLQYRSWEWGELTKLRQSYICHSNKNEAGLNLRSCLCPPLPLIAFKASFLQLFLIYTEPEEWIIADQKTGLFCYPIKNIHGDNVLPLPACDQRGSTNALGFTHLNTHVGVGISKLEVGSHRWHSKRQLLYFILFFYFF